MGKSRLVKPPSRRKTREAKARWTAWALVGGMAVVIGVMITLVVMQSRSKAASGTARVGSPAPDFTLRLFNGQSISLSSLKGKSVLVNFWSST